MQLRTEFCLRETGMKYTRILWHTLSISFFSKSTTFFVLKIIFALIIKLLLPPFLLLKLLPSSLSIVCRRQINKHTQIHGSTPTSHSGCAHSQNSSACATQCWFIQQQLWYQYFIMGWRHRKKSILLTFWIVKICILIYNWINNHAHLAKKHNTCL